MEKFLQHFNPGIMIFFTNGQLTNHCDSISEGIKNLFRPESDIIEIHKVDSDGDLNGFIFEATKNKDGYFKVKYSNEYYTELKPLIAQIWVYNKNLFISRKDELIQPEPYQA